MNIAVNISEMQRHQEHKARQERLWSGKTVAKALPDDEKEELQAEIKRLRQRNYELTFKLNNSDGARELESALATADDLHDRLAVASAQLLRQAEVMCDLRALSGKRRVVDIALEVLESFPGVTWEDIKTPARSNRISIPRQVCFAAVKSERPDLSYPQIGRAFGGFDHTSVMAAVRKIKAIMEGLKA